MTTLLSAPEQSRARYPDEDGYVKRDGVRVFWERYGTGERAILLPPTWEIVHSRFWKGQIPYLARHGRVVTFDPGATAAPTARATSRPTAAASSPPTPWPCWTRPGSTGRWWSPGATWASR
jgi:hypothetical protein